MCPNHQRKLLFKKFSNMSPNKTPDICFKVLSEPNERDSTLLGDLLNTELSIVIIYMEGSPEKVLLRSGLQLWNRLRKYSPHAAL